VQSEQLLTGTERTLPNLERNLVHLKHFAAALHTSDTDLLQALDGLATVGDVLRAHPGEFDATLANLVPLATNLGDVLNAREQDLADLAGQGRAVLDQVAQRADRLPSIAASLNGFLGVWIADLTVGPNWRILVTSAPASGSAYPPGAEPRPEPRAAAVARIAGTNTSVQDLAGVLLAPVETPDLQRMPVTRGIVRPLPVVMP
jgi:hypothetical protein